MDSFRKDCFKEADESTVNGSCRPMGRDMGVEKGRFTKEILGPLLSFVDEARRKEVAYPAATL